jgi:hypothetical protein
VVLCGHDRVCEASGVVEVVGRGEVADSMGKADVALIALRKPLLDVTVHGPLASRWDGTSCRRASICGRRAPGSG